VKHSKQLRHAVIMVLIAILTGGCITISQQLTVLDDGGAEVSMQVTAPPTVWTMVRSDLDIAELQEEVAADYPEASIEEIVKEDVGGIIVTVPFATVIETIVTGGLTGVGTGAEEAWFTEMSYVAKGTPFNRSHQFTATPNGKLLAGLQESMRDLSGETGFDLSLVSLQFSLTVPHTPLNAQMARRSPMIGILPHGGLTGQTKNSY